MNKLIAALAFLAATPAIAGMDVAPDLSPYQTTAAASATYATQAAMSAVTAKMPAQISGISGLMYASICSVVVNSSTAVSTFCPTATDSTSATKRTYPANYLAVGKAFRLDGGGQYSVPAANTLSADIKINVGAATVMTLTTPAAPVGTNQGVLFTALCTVRTSTTLNCQGRFSFVVAGTGLSADAPFNQTSTFDPTVANLIDVTGDWNGTTTSQSTTVTQAVLMALN